MSYTRLNGRTNSLERHPAAVPSPGLTRRRLFAAAAAATLQAHPGHTESATTAPTLANVLARYAETLSWTDVDAPTIETLKIHLVDSIGCAIPALREPTVRICRDVVLAEQSNGGATVFGTDKRVSPDLAAFANGMAIRYYDMNDVYVGPETGHPSDNIAAIMAVAETEKVSGQEFLLALALAYEVNCRFLDAVNLDDRGWDSTIPSLPAVALGAGKLMRLPVPQLEQALNLALNDHIATHQTRLGSLADWKGAADAEAGRNAVFATLLARGGLSGPGPIFEGKYGYFNQVTGPMTIDVAGFGGPGRPFLAGKASIKPYPAQVTTLTAIAAAAALRGRIDSTDAIKSIDVFTTRNGLSSAATGPEKFAPATKETADHSLPFVVARTLLDGTVAITSFTRDKLTDPRLHDLIARMHVTEDPALTALAPRQSPNRVAITLNDGRQLVEQVDGLPGFGGAPMQRSDAERKFRANIADTWSDTKIRQVLDTVWDLDHQPSLATLTGFLGMPG